MEIKPTIFRLDPHVLVIRGSKRYLNSVSNEALELWKILYGPLPERLSERIAHRRTNARPGK